MDNLRLTLLIIGCLFIVGIYLWEIFSNSKPRKNSDILDAVDDFPEATEGPVFPVSAKNQYGNFEDQYKEVTNLGSLLAQSRNESQKTSDIPVTVTTKEEQDKDSDEEDLPLHMSVKDYEETMDSEELLPEVNEKQDVVEEEMLFDEQNEQIEDDPYAPIPKSDNVYEDILVLYVVSPRHTLFNGLSISKAADEVGMIYGHMNVFHHFGPGKLHSGQPLFSMANMFEPGSFDLGKMADLKTKGIAMFMYSPASIDANVVFELFLNTTQRLSQYLGGEIVTVDNKPLDTLAIKSLREQADSLSEK